MANHPSYLLHFLTICVFIVRFVVSSPIDDFSILDFHGDYSPPAPPPPSTPPHPPTMSCEGDLKGVGSLDTVCELNCSLIFVDDVYIEGAGSFYILPGVRFSCPKSGCSISINVSSNFSLGVNSQIFAGMVYVAAGNASFQSGSLVNTTALGGEPPDHTSGSPKGLQGGGGGHGGRGASCVVDNKKLPEDVWGGDAYEWSSLDKPCGYGSKGGTTSKDDDYGGNGGGRIWLEVSEEIEADGSLLADGGDGGIKGGGGSGGSIYIKSHRMTGSGLLSASGGNGFAGGGGGRISVDIFSRHDDQTILVHGGKSYGCPKNSGSAGTFYDAIPRKLRVSNHNMSTDTDTPFFAFPNQPLWTSVDILELARVDVPLRWSRVQVQGQLALSMGAVLSFGLPHDAVSEFELMAEELLISDSVIKIYGALRMFVKLHLMLNSKMLIDGDGDDDSFVATTILEASNLLVLKGSSVIRSNANLGLHGQGSLNLTGSGNLIEAQHLVLSLFCSINVEPGSVLRGPLENSTVGYSPYCELQDCPMELLRPPEDCNVNSTLPFTLQICRVEDIVVEGLIEGSVLHFHMVRAVVVKSSGAITASGLGCIGGPGRGNFSSNTPGGGGGHGGKGGDGYYNGSFIEGGVAYGNADFPCELGSGSGNASLSGATAGGGVIVMGSLEHSLSSLSVYGSLTSNGESFGEKVREQDGVVIPEYGPGGGSGGTILFFVNRLALGDSSTISTVGGRGSPNSGGGGGGRVHFHWADITVGDEYQPLAHVNGTINIGGGIGRGNGLAGENGTISGKVCPKGLYGTFCEECPVGTFKNVSGSDITLCQRCPPRELPARGIYVPVRGGVADVPCPYKCVSETYHMPNCQTALEELIYTFGGPWLFGFILLSLLILFALVLSVARVKFVGAEEVPGLVPTRRGLHIDRSVPFLESLNEVLETNRNEESHTHVHRMYFMGSNTFSQPWHLPHSPPEQVTEIVYEDAFNRFAEEINVLAAYQWWEGSLYSILCIFAYPFSWSWLQWCRKNKIQRLREFVRSEYDHACLRSCRSRALYEGLKVSASSDLMLAYVDFFLGGDEKRDDLPPQLNERFPLSLVFGGDGSYMASFVLHSDNILTSLMSQAVPSTIWYRLVAGLNAQLRLVRRYQLKSTFRPVMGWLETHANPTLSPHGIQVHLARFQPTASGGCQFGLVVSAVEVERVPPPIERNGSFLPERQSSLGGTHPRKDYLREREPLITQRRIYEGISHTNGLQMLTDNILCYPFSFIICNTKPVGHQDLVGMVISILLLGDFILVLLTLLQLYSISMLDFLLVLFILPLGILLPFPAGISALFSHAPRRSSGLARFYAMWNITSLINVVVAFVCGYAHYMSLSSASNKHQNVQSWNLSMDDSGWWMLPSGLVLCKIIQAQLIDYHVANQEIQDRTLYCNDPNVFWQS